MVIIIKTNETPAGRESLALAISCEGFSFINSNIYCWQNIHKRDEREVFMFLCVGLPTSLLLTELDWHNQWVKVPDKKVAVQECFSGTKEMVPPFWNNKIIINDSPAVRGIQKMEFYFLEGIVKRSRNVGGEQDMHCLGVRRRGRTSCTFIYLWESFVTLHFSMAR